MHSRDVMAEQPEILLDTDLHRLPLHRGEVRERDLFAAAYAIQKAIYPLA